MVTVMVAVVTMYRHRSNIPSPHRHPNRHHAKPVVARGFKEMVTVVTVVTVFPGDFLKHPLSCKRDGVRAMQIDPEQLIRLSRSLGAEVYRSHDGRFLNIYYDAERMPPALLQLLAQHKPRLLPLLAPDPHRGEDHDR